MNDDGPPSMEAMIASIRDSLKGETSPPAAEPLLDDKPAPAPAAAPPPGDTTLEALVRGALEPLLKAWLDANLPEIVDRAARDEIARLTRG